MTLRILGTGSWTHRPAVQCWTQYCTDRQHDDPSWTASLRTWRHYAITKTLVSLYYSTRPDSHLTPLNIFRNFRHSRVDRQVRRFVARSLSFVKACLFNTKLQYGSLTQCWRASPRPLSSVLSLLVTQAFVSSVGLIPCSCVTLCYKPYAQLFLQPQLQHSTQHTVFVPYAPCSTVSSASAAA